MDEKQEERERGMIRDLLGELRKRREEEDEARNLIEEMQRNLDEAQNRSCEVGRKMNRILSEYIEAFDKERGRPQLIMTKLWQLMQSRDTKLNVNKGLDEILSNIKQTGWNESTRSRRFWTQDEDKYQQSPKFWTQATDGEHTVLCSRMGLREGDEGATGCLHAYLHEGKRTATRGALVRLA